MMQARCLTHQFYSSLAFSCSFSSVKEQNSDLYLSLEIVRTLFHDPLTSFVTQSVSLKSVSQLTPILTACAHLAYQKSSSIV